MPTVAVYLPFIFHIMFPNRPSSIPGTLLFLDDDSEVAIVPYTPDAICGVYDLQGAYFEMETYLMKPNDTSELYISHGKIFFLHGEDNTTKLYLTVNETGRVQATEDGEEASQFTIRTNQKYHKLGSFFIDYTWPSNANNSTDSDDEDYTTPTSKLGLASLDELENHPCNQHALFVGDHDVQILSGRSDELQLIH